MTNYNDPDKVEARASQEDPIIMYLIVREFLGMSIGKTAAQCAHASQMLQIKYSELEKTLNELESLEQTFGSLTKDESVEWASEQPKFLIFNEWLNSSFRKVVLRADDKQWNKLKELSSHVLVVDAGLTEISAGSETVIGLWPMRKSQAPKIVKRLQVLK